MNRPKKELYENNDYVKDLEKYCDFIEEWLEYTTSVAEINQELANKCEIVEVKLDKYQKALYMACEIIVGQLGACPKNVFGDCEMQINNKEQCKHIRENGETKCWKEWLLKDE